jgi:hypothetical protein
MDAGQWSMYTVNDRYTVECEDEVLGTCRDPCTIGTVAAKDPNSFHTRTQIHNSGWLLFESGITWSISPRNHTVLRRCIEAITGLDQIVSFARDLTTKGAEPQGQKILEVTACIISIILDIPQSRKPTCPRVMTTKDPSLSNMNIGVSNSQNSRILHIHHISIVRLP